MFCHKCGTQIDEDAVFCYKCGTKVVRKGSEMPIPDTETGSTKKSNVFARSNTRLIGPVLLVIIVLVLIVTGTLKNVWDRFVEINTEIEAQATGSIVENGWQDPSEDDLDDWYDENEFGDTGYFYPTFDDLFRTDAYIGESICIECQFVYSTASTAYCNMDGNYVMVNLANASGERLASDDRIRVYGTYKGLKSDLNLDVLQSSAGAPYIIADSYELLTQ